MTRIRRRRSARALLALAAVALGPGSALAQFGRNKLQHQIFDFQVIRTAHFDVHYYPEERQAALDAARMAERSYSRLSRILGHEFDERKPIILYASHTEFQQTNALPGFIGEGTGGVTEFAKRRVILPFTGSYAEFEHVLTHELVHAFQFDLLAQGLVGQLGQLGFRLPLWFMEGMAEYLSIGGLDAHTHAWVRDALLTGYLRTIPEMSTRDDFLSYRFGQSLFAFIGAKYGDETIGLMLQRAVRMGIPAAIGSTIGLPLESLSEDWIESVRTRYLPEVARHGGPDRIADRLTDHRFRPGSGESASYLAPALSPDGRDLVYLSDRGNDLYSFFDLWLASGVDGTPRERLVRASRTADFESLRFLTSSAAWSPDGRYVAFVAKVGGGDVLYLYDVRRLRVARAIEVGLDGLQNPSFSPDGSRVVVTGIQGGISDLYVIDLTDGDIRRLTDDRYADLHPSWSPDGRYIALTTDRGDDTDFGRLEFGNYRIGLYEVGTGRIEILPDQDAGKNINPVWSPDGQAIAFVSDRTGRSSVYLWSRPDRRLYRLTDLLSDVTGITPLSPALSWAASADRLAITYFEGAGYNVYVIDDPRSLARPIRTGSRQVVAGTAGPGAGASSASAAVEDATTPGSNGDTSLLEPLGAAAASQSYYATGEGFRRSELPAAADEGEPPSELTVAALLEDARLGLPDTSSFEFRDYRARLTPDVIGRPVIGAQVGGFGNGVYGGSYIVLSDMLGNHNALLSGQIAGSLNDAFLLAQYAYLRERVNLAMSYRQFPLYRFRGTTVLDESASLLVEDRFLRDVYRTLTTTAHYPFNTFQRLELSLVGTFISRDSIVDRFVVRGDASTGERLSDRIENLVLAGPSVALVWDNSLSGYMGPIDGRRYRIELGRFFGDVRLNDMSVDLRHYFNLGGQWAIATRALGLWRSGESAEQFRLFWGGPYFLRGYDGGSFTRAECIESAKRVRDGLTSGCPVRDQLVGSSFALTNVELRFPIFDFLDLGFAPLGLPPIGGAVFVDLGAAFDDIRQLVWGRGSSRDPLDARAPLAAYGAGLRANILFTVLRVDYAVPLDRPDHDGGVWSLSFGPTF